ncbi:MAG: hypothetical protein AAF800_10810 [Planctomycetota bacterium]
MPEADRDYIGELKRRIYAVLRPLEAGKWITIHDLRDQIDLDDPELLTLLSVEVADDLGLQMRYVVINPATQQQWSESYRSIGDIPERIRFSFGTEIETDQASVLPAFEKAK